MTEREALESVVSAWNALPSGYYDAMTVQSWIREHMWHAVNDAREALGERRADKNARLID